MFSITLNAGLRILLGDKAQEIGHSRSWIGLWPCLETDSFCVMTENLGIAFSQVFLCVSVVFFRLFSFLTTQTIPFFMRLVLSQPFTDLCVTNLWISSSNEITSKSGLFGIPQKKIDKWTWEVWPCWNHLYCDKYYEYVFVDCNNPTSPCCWCTGPGTLQTLLVIE